MKLKITTVAFFCISILNLCAQTITIPDANFKTALLTHIPAIDTNNDGLIQVSEVENLINLYIPYKSISDLTGIEAFTNLRSLTCTDNNLTSINLSQNVLLQNLELGQNNINTIDLSKNTNLQILGLQGNGLTTIDVSKNTALRELKVEYNALTQLDISENPSIWYLNFSDNPISNINLSPARYLSALVATNTLLTSLNLSCHDHLSYVVLEDNALLTSICLNSIEYANRTAISDPEAMHWIKSTHTSWTNCPTLPAVTPVPATITPVNICETGDMTFNAVSEAFITNPTYKWQKATSASGPWTNISGATNQSLVLTDLQLSDNGSIYKVLISSTDYCGTGHMEEAAGQLIIHPLIYPEVSAEASVQGPVCDNAAPITYTATPVSGSGTDPFYQWYYYTAPTYTPIPGATGLTYTPAVIPPNGTELFVGMFTDEMCAVESGVASNVLVVEKLPVPAPVMTSTDLATCTPVGHVLYTSNTAASGTHIQWYKNGNPIPSSNTPNLTIDSHGTYHMTEDNGACETASATVTINALPSSPDPQVTISSSLTGAACDTLQKITYTATPVPGTVSAPTYQWYNSATNTAINGATNAVYTPAAKPVNGDKVYVVIHKAEACVANPHVQSNTLTAVILPTPAPVMVSANTALCVPAGHVLQTSNTAATGTQLVWYKDGNPIANSNTSDFTIASAGTYHITESNGACEITSASVTINALPFSADPQVSISSSLVGPACDTLQHITYTATPVPGTVTAPTYQWYNAATNTAINGATNAVYTPAAKPVNGDKVYVVIHKADACVVNPDVQSNTLTAVILPTPSPVMVSTDTVLCMPQEYILYSAQTSASGTQLQWYKDGNISVGMNAPHYTIEENEFPGGVYHISESNAACTIHSDPVTVELMRTPVLTQVDDIYVHKGETIQLNVPSEYASHYLWSPAAGLSDQTSAAPAFYATASTTLTLQATNDSNRCPVTTTVNVNIIAEIKIPNVITVNGDGVNDTWEIENLSFYPNVTFEIMNRWGNIVWKSEGNSKQWDGSNYRSNEMLPAGTYFYIINLNSAKKTEPYTGYIQIVN